MSDDVQRDKVDDALLQMGLFDEHEAAIERAEAQGVVAEVPKISSAKLESIVAASLRAAAPESEVEAASSPTQRWIPWACGAAVAVAAALVLWQSPPSTDPGAVAPAALPSAQLKLGGTARTLGDTPRLRSYGPGDAFFVELSFDTPLESPVFAELFAHDAAGTTTLVPLSLEKRNDVLLFDGEIAALLPPGTWTLQVRYGSSDVCTASLPNGCKTLETRIEVVGP